MSGSVPKGLDGTAYQKLVKVVKDAGKKGDSRYERKAA